MSDLFSCDLPDLDSFIRELDLLDENTNEAVRRGMHEGADIILAEQRRQADATGVPFLSEHIREGRVYTTRKGTIGVTTGYMPEAFEDHDGVQPGVVGLTYEFGRPGQSRTRNSETTLRHMKSGKTYTVCKGKISPRPHIRPGFDRKVGEASEKVITSVTNETEKVFNE